MAPGVDHQGAGVPVDVLERHPDPAHVAVGEAVEVERVAVGRLLGPGVEVEGLEGDRLALVQGPQDVEQLPVGGDRAHVLVEVPRLGDAPVHLRIPRGQVADDALGDPVEVRQVQVDDHEAALRELA